jgi:hypothetical protein
VVYIKPIVKNDFEDSRLGNAQFSCDIVELVRGSRFTAAIMAFAVAVVGTVCGERRLVPETRCRSHVNSAARSYSSISRSSVLALNYSQRELRACRGMCVCVCVRARARVRERARLIAQN